MRDRITNNENWLRICFIWVGYGILILAVLDVITLFTPSNFLNSPWELQLVGNLIERAPVPLLGLMFVFFGSATGGSKITLQVLSSLCIIAGLAYLLLLPLGLRATWQINNQNQLDISAQFTQENNQVQERRAALKTTSAQNLDQAFILLRQQGKAGGAQNATQLKERLFSELNQIEQKITTNAEEKKKTVQLELLKNSLKWNAGVVVAGVVYLALGQFTFWRNQRAVQDNWSTFQF